MARILWIMLIPALCQAHGAAAARPLQVDDLFEHMGKATLSPSNLVAPG